MGRALGYHRMRSRLKTHQTARASGAWSLAMRVRRTIGRENVRLSGEIAPNLRKGSQGVKDISVTIKWECGGDVFTDQRYSRAHRWHFDGGAEVPASSSPEIVPVPMSDATAVDPEEAFVASLASCHMLWFLALAAKKGWVIEHYQDAARGQMGKDARGKLMMKVVILRPEIRWASTDEPPAWQEVEAMHHRAHEECFIANSVKTEIRLEPMKEGEKEVGDGRR